MLQKSGDAFYLVILVGGGFSPAFVVRCPWPKDHATGGGLDTFYGLKAMLQKSGDAFYSVILVGGGFSPAVFIVF
ncbi:hypothetical protein [Aliiglaciecola lipolytica]|uniref:hypothetical protein n=1 Tax=Aliiglaciecola lipolytica TaxID=477689 RepID=UPI001C0852B0|nr:hypothetical protein [Aliiglaciecola lipolytica]MBU2876732.1 hypothetical protein [Aliiglaciecola lipolytica]